MAGALDESSSRDARPLEVRVDAYSGPLARVRGSPDPSDEGQPIEPTVHGSADLDISGALDESFSRDARPLK
eukprot:1417826-Pleurochrysis_carterae.AAC.1